MRTCILAIACLAVQPAAWPDGLWKCGDVFTDQPTAAAGRRCMPATATAVVVASPRIASAAPSRSSSRVEPVTQDGRDREARDILLNELAETRDRRTALLASEKSTPPAAFAAELRRLDSDIDGLRREIDRRPKETQ